MHTLRYPGLTNRSLRLKRAKGLGARRIWDQRLPLGNRSLVLDRKVGASRARETLPCKAAEWDRVVGGGRKQKASQEPFPRPVRAGRPLPAPLSFFFSRVVIIECGELDVLAFPSLSSTKAARGWSFPGISQKEMASVRTALMQLAALRKPVRV
jgi:hypothetical protein